MKISIVCFTKHGYEICKKLIAYYESLSFVCAGYAKERYIYPESSSVSEKILGLTQSVSEWTGEHFSDSDALIYIGAAGIAVRSIAPYLQNKWKDPAVLVIDEMGNFVIPVLSGHAGGANRLARHTADTLHATCVITTATDVEQRFAVDVFAVEQKLHISDYTLAKRISAELLDGHEIGFFSDEVIRGKLPVGLVDDRHCSYNIWITTKTKPEASDVFARSTVENSNLLRLIPTCLYIGIGCRKGTSQQQIADAVEAVLRQNYLDRDAVAGLASIDLKKEEPGLLAYARENAWSLTTFSAEQLMKAKGEFRASEFVKQTTGSDNVCERAAMTAAGAAACLMVPKQIMQGVTVAIAWQCKEYVI